MPQFEAKRVRDRQNETETERVQNKKDPEDGGVGSRLLPYSSIPRASREHGSSFPFPSLSHSVAITLVH